MLLSEITGKTNDEVFKVKGWTGEFKINFMDTLFRRPNEKCDWIAADSNVVLSVIRLSPEGIIHLPPPLTDEQREQLKALYTLGYRWITRDKYGSIYVHEESPCKKAQNSWLMHLLITKPAKCFESLVTYPDPEPYDIGKALGVEG